MMTGRLTRGAIAAVLLLVGVVAMQGQAAADPTCPGNSVCLFSDPNFGGQEIIVGGLFTVNDQIPNMHIISCSGCVSTRHSGSNGTWGDQLSSFINNTVINYCWWFDINYSSGSFSTMPAGASGSYGDGGRLADQASSVKLC
jgi:hypothetical protein